MISVTVDPATATTVVGEDVVVHISGSDLPLGNFPSAASLIVDWLYGLRFITNTGPTLEHEPTYTGIVDGEYAPIPISDLTEEELAAVEFNTSPHIQLYAGPGGDLSADFTYRFSVDSTFTIRAWTVSPEDTSIVFEDTCVVSVLSTPPVVGLLSLKLQDGTFVPVGDDGRFKVKSQDGTWWQAAPETTGSRELRLKMDDGSWAVAAWMTTPPPPWLVMPGMGGWIWDAGLFLGASFSELTGLPATLPDDAYELDFIVLTAGEPLTDFSHTSPWGETYRYRSGGSTSTGHSYDGSVAAGSHLWVIWYGPEGDTDDDPPPPMHPSTLVPATLAAGGTA